LISDDQKRKGCDCGLVYLIFPQTSQEQLEAIQTFKEVTLVKLKSLKILEERILTQNRTLNDKEKKWFKSLVDEHVCLMDDLHDVDDLPTR